ncbi:MAG TPA: flavin reductase, partial [Micromonospora sp.]
MRVPRPHRPGRPHWRCTACGAPYPCGPGRVALLMAYDVCQEGAL